jgi:hypothetical protein
MITEKDFEINKEKMNLKNIKDSEDYLKHL